MGTLNGLFNGLVKWGVYLSLLAQSALARQVFILLLRHIFA